MFYIKKSLAVSPSLKSLKPYCSTKYKVSAWIIKTIKQFKLILSIVDEFILTEILSLEVKVGKILQ